MPIYQATIALATDEHKYTQIKAKPYLTADALVFFIRCTPIKPSFVIPAEAGIQTAFNFTNARLTSQARHVPCLDSPLQGALAPACANRYAGVQHVHETPASPCARMTGGSVWVCSRDVAQRNRGNLTH